MQYKLTPDRVPIVAAAVVRHSELSERAVYWHHPSQCLSIGAGEGDLIGIYDHRASLLSVRQDLTALLE